jgi:hypothetical protein
MKEFYQIRGIACEHFYKWEDGEDFDWLRKEWPKFKRHLNSNQEIEEFILTLAYFYNLFCHISYFEGESDIEKAILKPSSKNDSDQVIYDNFDKTLDILIKVYTCPYEVLRQFSTIFIQYEIPHFDGHRFIYRLFDGRWIDWDSLPKTDVLF